MENGKRNNFFKMLYLPPASKVAVYHVEYKKELVGKIAFR